MPGHSLVCVDTTLLLGRKTVYISNWSWILQMDSELDRQYRPTLAMAPSFIGIRLRHNPQTRHKTSSRWRVVLSTNDRRTPDTFWRGLTCTRYREEEKRRANHPCNKHLRHWIDPISSDQRATTWGTPHKKRPGARTETRWILPNCSTPHRATQYEIFCWQPRHPSSKIDSRRNHVNCGTRNTSRTHLRPRTSSAGSRNPGTKTCVWHAQRKMLLASHGKRRIRHHRTMYELRKEREPVQA